MGIPRNERNERAVAHLRSGGVLIYPTETSYAIGCDATNARAVARVFAAKGRVAEKSLPLIVASRAMAKRYARWNAQAEVLARVHWPGPLTLVLPYASGARLARGVVAEDRTIALRVSSHPVARALCRRLGRPIVATSANIAGAPPAFTVAEVERFVRHLKSPPLVLTAGDLPPCPPSTIVALTSPVPCILRQGSIVIAPHI
ncbi:MAG: L-threonylcarbamoyladenylate synthase [bacterium]|nr:L-threonylcarbamoyladenylate synthase [bacterium]